MSDAATTVVTGETTPANFVATPKARPTAAESLAKQNAADAAKKAAKKTPKPVAAKKPAPKGKPAAKKAAAPAKKGAEKPAAKTDGLRKPQVRILEALKSGKELTRAEIAEAAGCDVAWLNSWIGSRDAETRAKNDLKLKSLLTWKYVAYGTDREETRAKTYRITAAGKAAIQKA